MQGIDPVNAPPDADDAWILVQDLRKVVGESGRLEKDLNTTNRGIVIGPALVQVVAISNISQPSYNQNGSPKMLYVTFTDGATKCRGVVLNPISGITLHTPPGSKCLLVNCQVWRGCLMLDQKTCTFLGGKVNSLINSWKDQQERMLQKDIAVAAGLKFTTRRGDDKPPPFENFKQGQTKRVKKQLPKQEVQKKACSSFKQLGKSQNRVSGRLDDIRVDESELILEISDLSNSKQCLPAGTQLKSMLLHGAPTGALLDARLDKLGKAFKQKLLIFDVDPDTKSIHNIEQSRAPPPAPVHKDLSAEAKEFVPPGAKGPKGTRGGGGGSNVAKGRGGRGGSSRSRGRGRGRGGRADASSTTQGQGDPSSTSRGRGRGGRADASSTTQGQGDPSSTSRGRGGSSKAARGKGTRGRGGSSMRGRGGRGSSSKPKGRGG